MNDASVDFARCADPLLRDVSLAFAATLAVLGIPTRFETNSAHVLGVVHDTFGAWRAVTAEPDAAPVRVRIVVHDGSEFVEGHAPVRHVCPDATRVLVHTPGSHAIVDPERRDAVAYVTTALVADRAHFRDAMLEAITFALLAHHDRHPLHAAAIVRDDRAVLLAGPSGSGKSTLAYLAHQAGLTVLGDDHVWVQQVPRLRIWGAPSAARLLPDSLGALPGAAGTPSVVNGKTKLAVPLRADVGAAREAVVCVLRRGDRAALEPLASDAVIDALRVVDPGFDRFPARHAAVIGALAATGGWRLTLSADPRDALPLLNRMLR